MSRPTFPITGIQTGRGPNGAVPLRYELDRFVDPAVNPHAADQLNLFLLGLKRMQEAPRSELLSWFQVAGIHGEPFVDWDGSAATVNPGNPNQWLGYCTHASILFPVWHRVYQCLVEQAVKHYMSAAHATFAPAERTRLQPALDAWRFPYWDWALVHDGADGRRLRVSELLRSERVPVQTPTGPAQIDNPLYRYPFPIEGGTIPGVSDTEISATLAVPTSRTPYTVRHPAAYNPRVDFQSQTTWSQGISDNAAVEDALNFGLGAGSSFGRQLVADTYALFAKVRSYPPFSNTRWTGTGSVRDYLSLEAVHNTIHIWCGGLTFGHMSLNEVAAFDPIFWFHHGNVERLHSVFQALNPADFRNWPNDAWISGTREPWFSGISQPDGGGGTWTTPAGRRETTTTPLTPFHRDARGTVWNADNARNITDLGYAFEELQPWLPKYNQGGRFDEPAFVKDVRASLVQKYGWAVPSARQLGAIRSLAEGGGVPQGGFAAPPPPPGSGGAEPQGLVSGLVSSAKQTVLGAPSAPPLEHHFNEWVVCVRVDRFALKGHTFVVHVFLGGVPGKTLEWETAPTQVGVVAVFGSGRIEKATCSNCEAQAGDDDARLLTGQLSITSSLLDLIEEGKALGGLTLASLEREEVAPFLKRNLHWRVSTLGATECDIHELPSLKVSVAVCKAVVPDADDELISYGEFELLELPTQGRLGGFDPVKETF